MFAYRFESGFRILAILFCIALMTTLFSDPGVAGESEEKDASTAKVPSDSKETHKDGRKGGDKGSKEVSGQKDPAEKSSVTTHVVQIGGKDFEYTATAGTIVLNDEKEKPAAEFFYVAYTLNGLDDLSQRPLTFAFNGGPGSASVWLHMGALGPRRVLLQEDGSPLPPPARIVDNEFSILDLTDLVFIDPVTTGYSRAHPLDTAKKFHGVTSDIESVGDFIRLYTTRKGRWLSPKFVAGESYGTTRAAALAKYMADRHGLFFNGVMLISAILNFQTARFDAGNDLPYILFFPTYTATGWFHNKLPKRYQDMSLSGVLEEAQAFADEEYRLALAQGGRLGDKARQRVVGRYAELTGLSPTYVDRSDLRVEPFRFFKELLRDQGLTVGRMDSRLTGFDRDRAGEHPEFDPSLSPYIGPYTAALQHHIRQTLKFESDRPYEILTGKVQPWKWDSWSNRYLNVAEDLREALSVVRGMDVFVASGYYDLATPYFATDYTIDHLGGPAELRSRFTVAYYEGGHMMYNRLSELKKFKADAARWFELAMKSSID